MFPTTQCDYFPQGRFQIRGRRMEDMRLLERIISEGSSMREKIECARELLTRLDSGQVRANSIELMHNRLEGGGCKLEDEVWQGQPIAIKELLQDIAIQVESIYLNSRRHNKPRNHSGSFRIPAHSPDSGSWGREAERKARDAACGLHRRRRTTDY
jgi:hypothetical protein